MVALPLAKVGRKSPKVGNLFLQIISLTYPVFPKSTPKFELSYDKLLSILSFLFALRAIHQHMCSFTIAVIDFSCLLPLMSI